MELGDSVVGSLVQGYSVNLVILFREKVQYSVRRAASTRFANIALTVSRASGTCCPFLFSSAYPTVKRIRTLDIHEE